MTNRYRDDDKAMAAAKAASLRDVSPPKGRIVSDEGIIEFLQSLFTHTRHTIPTELLYGTLRNCGNSCYINAALQFLYQIDEIRHFYIYTDLSQLGSIILISRDNHNDYMKLIIVQILFILLAHGTININMENISGINIYDRFLELFFLERNAQDSAGSVFLRLCSPINSIINLFTFEEIIQNPILSSMFNLLKTISFNDISIHKCINSEQYIVNNEVNLIYYVNYDKPELGTREPVWKNYANSLDLPLNGRSIQECINRYQSWVPQEEQRLDSCGTKYYNNVYHKLDHFRETSYYIISLTRRYVQNENIRIDQDITISNEIFRLRGCIMKTGGVGGGHYYYINFDENNRQLILNDSRMSPPDINMAPTDMSKLGVTFLYKKIRQHPSILPFLRYQELSQYNHSRGIEIEFPRITPAAASAAASSAAASAAAEPIIQKLRTKIQQINDKLKEVQLNPKSDGNRVGLNGFIRLAIDLYNKLREDEKTQIGPFIPNEALKYMERDIVIEKSLIISQEPTPPPSEKEPKFVVYTTGFAYFGNSGSKSNKLQLFVNNIVSVLNKAGYSNEEIRFIHFDSDFNESNIYGYHTNEIFYNKNLTLEIIKKDIEFKLNVLLLDLAHIITYYKGEPVIKVFNPFAGPGKLDPTKFLRINCFYPGFLDNMSEEFIKHFIFFKIESGNIVTFIDKGSKKDIIIETKYKDISKYTFVDFSKPILQINGVIGQLYDTEPKIIEINKIFWEDAPVVIKPEKIDYKVKLEEMRQRESERKKLLELERTKQELEIRKSTIPQEISQETKLPLVENHKKIIDKLISQLDSSNLTQEKVLFLEFYDCIVPIKFVKNINNMERAIHEIVKNPALLQKYREIFIELYKKYDYINIISIYPHHAIKYLMDQIIPKDKNKKPNYFVIYFYDNFDLFETIHSINVLVINLIDRLLKWILSYTNMMNIQNKNITIINHRKELQFIEKNYGINVIIKPDDISGIPYLTTLL